MSTANAIKVLITGAAGRIASAMIPLVCNGLVFGKDKKVILHLLEITPCLERLEGVKMEIEDCAYPLLEELITTDSLEIATKSIDWAILIGGFSVRGSSFERSDLLSGNVPIFSEMGKAIDKHAKKSVKIVVVANPANTNAATLAKYTPSIPKKNISALTRLDQNRAYSLLARKLGGNATDIKRVAIWGNHSRTQIGDVSKATFKGKDLKTALNDDKFFESDFNEFLRGRFYAIVDKLGVTSSMSAANAVKDHIFDWIHGTAKGETASMSVISDGNPHGVSAGLIFSFPVTISGGEWSFAEGYTFDENTRKLLQDTENELKEEWALAETFCK